MLAEFAAGCQALRDRLARAARLDLDAVRSRYELGIGIARFVTLSLGQWFALVAAHDRRHLWLARRAAAALSTARTGAPSSNEVRR